MRLIDADALLDAICGCFNIMEAQGIDVTVARTIAKGIIDAAPAVDAAPVVHARWTTNRTLEHDGEWYCTNCDYEPTVFENTNYCPHCGAKMDAPTCGPDYCEIGGGDDDT